MKYIVQTKDLFKTYIQGEVKIPALKNVTLTVKPGEFLAVMGPSGSGKSTFMNIIGCLDGPTSGNYLFEDIEINKYSKDKLAWIRNKKIGFIFQNFNLIPRTTALENVEVPLFYHTSIFSAHKSKQRALECLKAVGLEGRENHTPSQLSGGEQQRVAIARALINNPSLILADEPTGNLDTKTGLEIMSIFQKLNKEKHITIIMVTHDPDISYYSKRNILFRDGVIQKDFVVPIQHDADSDLENYISSC